MKTQSLFRLLICTCLPMWFCQVSAQEQDAVIKAKIAERDDLRQQAIELANSGKLDEAIDRLEHVYKIDQKIFGETHTELLTTLNLLFQVANIQQDFVAVVAYREREKVLTERLYGKNDYRTQDALRAVQDAKADAARSGEDRGRLRQAAELHREVIERYSAGDYNAAIPIARENLKIREEILGKESPIYATSQNNLATIYYHAGDYARAEPLYLESIQIREKVLGKQHPEYAASLNNLAAMYYSMGDKARAEPLYREAMQIEQKVLGNQHPSYARSLNNLAALYVSMADYSHAEPLYLEAMQIRKRVFGNQHPDYAYSLNGLGLLYQSMGDYSRAEPLYLEAMQIEESVLGKQHPSYATSLNNLAQLYNSMGDYGRAEPLFLEAMQIQQKVLGNHHPSYATSLNNLALLYQDMGDHARAEPLFLESMQITEKVLGKEHADYATSLSNLGLLYESRGDDLLAEPLYREALVIRERVQGKQHPDYANSLDNLASLYDSNGDSARAESLCREAIQIYERVHGKHHPRYAITLNRLASIYHRTGNLARAESHYREAIQIQKKAVGEEHPDYAETLTILALLYETEGDYGRAEPLYREALQITLRSLQRTADVQSQRQQVTMGESLRYRLDACLSIAKREPKFQLNTYAALLQWKGSVWQRQQRQRLLVDQPALKPQFAELSSVSSRLSTLILSPPNDPQQLEVWRRQLEELTLHREKVERDLSLASAEFQQTTVAVTPDQLRSSLPEGTVLLDFLEYNFVTPANQEQKTKDSRERHLLVHVVRADQPVRSIDLGAVDTLTDLVQTWRSDFGQSPAAVEAAQKLRQQIWDPLQESLSGVTMVYVSPDGVLGQFPLGALPGTDPEKYLLEELAIVMLPVPQGLPAMLSESQPSADATHDRFCLIGGVDYEQVSSAEDNSQPETPESNSALQMLAVRGSQHQQYGALPGTLAEVKTIESLIRQHRPSAQATILQGSLASESLFAQVAPGHRYLHVATHGFFAPESVKNALAASSTDISRLTSGSDPSSRRIVGSHPDLLSGLVFAGANQPTAIGEDDGILTAAEVQSLDLRGVELAILSACETGLGRTAGGEGIIGLQRAFQLSGAKTTITSLWQVDDAATQALMVEFYRNLFERKLSKLESLRQAQIWLLNHPGAIEGQDLSTRGSITKVKPLSSTPKPTRSLPAYWAAFQLSGDPG